MPRRKRVDPRVPVSVGFTSQLGQVLASRAGKLLGISGPTRHWFPLEGGTHTFRSNREVFLKGFFFRSLIGEKFSTFKFILRVDYIHPIGLFSDSLFYYFVDFS